MALTVHADIAAEVKLTIRTTLSASRPKNVESPNGAMAKRIPSSYGTR